MSNLKLDNIHANRSSLRWRKYWSDQISSYCEFGIGMDWVLLLSPLSALWDGWLFLAPVNFAFWVLSNLVYYADDQGYPSCPPWSWRIQLVCVLWASPEQSFWGSESVIWIRGCVCVCVCLSLFLICSGVKYLPEFLEQLILLMVWSIFTWNFLESEICSFCYVFLLCVMHKWQVYIFPNSVPEDFLRHSMYRQSPHKESGTLPSPYYNVFKSGNFVGRRL